MNSLSSSRKCIYCDGNVRRARKGKYEHIIPEALGGALTFDKVCHDCNNQTSDIDRELCSRSPFSIIASKILDNRIWQCWDIVDNILLEATPMWNPKPAMKLYPQMMFDLKGPAILGDLEEMQRFGCKNFSDLLMNSILKTFRKYHSDIRGYLHFERIDNDIIKSTKYKYPPRIYWAHPIFELAHRVNNNKKAPFVLRYLNSSDMKYALYCLDNWKSNIKSDAPVIQRGSHTPQMRCFYNPSEVYRAIAKISINLLSYLCNCTF